MALQGRTILIIFLCLVAYGAARSVPLYRQGASFTMDCQAPVGTMFVTWKKVQLNYTSIVGSNQNLEAPFAATGRMSLTMLEEGQTVTYTLTIINLHLEDAGTYSCHSGLNTSSSPLRQEQLMVREPISSVDLYYQQTKGVLTDLLPSRRFELPDGAPCTFLCYAKGYPAPEAVMVLENHDTTLRTKTTTRYDIQGDPVRDVGLLQIRYELELATISPEKIVFPGNSSMLQITCSAKVHPDDFMDKTITIYKKVTSDGRKCSGSLFVLVLLSLLSLLGL